MHDSTGVPACFSSNEKLASAAAAADDLAVTRSGQSVFMSVYQTKLAGQCRLITVTWCKNLLLHGLSVTVQGIQGDEHYQCKVELKPWYFWRKQGSKHFIVDGKTVNIVWDLKAAKFNGETEPRSDYYVAIVCEEEVVLLLGDQKKEAFRKTGCRPSLIEPMLVSKKEHVFGKKKFCTRIKFEEKGPFHDISIEYNNNNNNNSIHDSNNSNLCGFDPGLEVKVDGKVVVRVKHLQWKFRGNEAIHISKNRVEVYWNVHDWLFGSGARHGLFIFKQVSSSPSMECGFGEDDDMNGDVSVLSSSFCLFLYAWKVE